MLKTERLLLIPATPALARADLAGPNELSAALAIPVHPDWPPPLFDGPAIEHSLWALEQDPTQFPWTYHYIVRRSEPLVVGIVGYKAKPDPEGMVEIGYGVVAREQGQGIATEAAAGLIRNAFATPEVTRVLGETLPTLVASIAVMEKNGLRLIGEGSEPGVIRYEITRADYESGRTSPAPHLHTLLRLLAHLGWADRRALHALSIAASPPPRLLELYAHVLGAEAIWLSRLTGDPPLAGVWPTLSIDECRELAARLDQEYRRWVWWLTPADLRRMVSYRNSAGEAFESVVEDILLQVCLHGSYHRGQIASGLRAAGETPSPTDFIAFVRGSPAATRGPAPK
jgi:RimJ/RimL family protein N-acetyltransferase/uncharacterized damage-inducible protein DinB